MADKSLADTYKRRLLDRDERLKAARMELQRVKKYAEQALSAAMDEFNKAERERARLEAENAALREIAGMVADWPRMDHEVALRHTFQGQCPFCFQYISRERSNLTASQTDEGEHTLTCPVIKARDCVAQWST